MSQENLNKALKLTKENKTNVAIVFDLDSTLFCMKYRTQAIIKDYIKKDPFVTQSSLKTKMNQIEVKANDWSIQEILKRYGLDTNTELLKSLSIFWRKSFFTNEYLHYDQPYTGSLQFVKKLQDLGGHLFYLTARKRVYMGEGTLKTLNHYGFPLKTESHLILKSSKEISDESYKKKELVKINQQFKTVLFFENEPVILNFINQNIKDIHLFWINSTHSRREEPPKTALPISMDYNF